MYVLRAAPEGNSEATPCQTEESPVLPDSFIQIYILVLVGFYIGPPKMHRRFHIGLPKCIDRIGRPKVSLNLLPQKIPHTGNSVDP